MSTLPSWSFGGLQQQRQLLAAIVALLKMSLEINEFLTFNDIFQNGFIDEKINLYIVSFNCGFYLHIGFIL